MSKDLVVAVSTFILGLTVGLVLPDNTAPELQARACPVVQGETPVLTKNDNGVQTCSYVRTPLYGLALTDRRP